VQPESTPAETDATAAREP